MNYEVSALAVVLFLAFVCFVVGISFYLGSRTKSADGYYAAGGNIHWAVNGVAFAGDYLSAASFLGICGMIATKGYDGFLYSIGYLAGWMVALFLVAEPMKRLGKYTFTDALDCKFNSKAIQLTAAISTLIVSIFYLIPQMVGAGVLVEPLLGFPHWVGVVFVGIIVTVIVATAGMASTTYVQFMKGGLLIIFSTILTIAILTRGLDVNPDADGEIPYHNFTTLEATVADGAVTVADTSYQVVSQPGDAFIQAGYAMLAKDGINSIWKIKGDHLEETLNKIVMADGTVLFNGAVKEDNRFFKVGSASKLMVDGQEVTQTGAVGPLEFLKIIRESEIVLWGKKRILDGGNTYDIFYQKPTPGKKILRPGMKFKVEGTFLDKLNFVSLMLALFCGTAALPHILIRYYTVPSQADARKSTIVAIGAIGFFYVLTLFMGIGAMTNGVINVLDGNMSAPLVALSFGVVLFSIISSIAFSTVLGTVSGLIVAASGAIAHDLLTNFMGMEFDDAGKVRAGKISAVVVGCIGILLGIAFKGMNVSFLVGWAFAVAASANLPSIIMILFWKRTTSQGIAASIVVGIVSSLGIILVSPTMYDKYGLLASDAISPLNNPGIVSIPLAFIALIVVSLMTKGIGKTDEELEAAGI